MPYVAHHKHSPVSPRKARLVIDLIRGRNLNEALRTLHLQPQRAARMITKLLRSAQANAEDRGVTDVDNLYVSKAQVGDGLRLKRWRPRARGSAAQILRRRSHITVELDVREGEE
jgi:large subunit ribosomal protein L22